MCSQRIIGESSLGLISTSYDHWFDFTHSVLSDSNLTQAVYERMPFVSKQYKLLPVKE